VEQRTLALSHQIEMQKRLQKELESSRRTLTGQVAELDQRNREIQLLNELGDVVQACVSPQEAYPVVALFAPDCYPLAPGRCTFASPAASCSLWPRNGGLPRRLARLQERRLLGLEAEQGARGSLRAGPAALPPRGGRGLLAVRSTFSHGENIGLFHLTGCAHGAQDFAVSVAEHVGLASPI